MNCVFNNKETVSNKSVRIKSLYIKIEDSIKMWQYTLWDLLRL